MEPHKRRCERKNLRERGARGRTLRLCAVGRWFYQQKKAPQRATHAECRCGTPPGCLASPRCSHAISITVFRGADLAMAQRLAKPLEGGMRLRDLMGPASGLKQPL